MGTSTFSKVPFTPSKSEVYARQDISSVLSLKHTQYLRDISTDKRFDERIFGLGLVVTPRLVIPT